MEIEKTPPSVVEYKESPESFHSNISDPSRDGRLPKSSSEGDGKSERDSDDIRKYGSYESHDLELAGSEEPAVAKYEEVAIRALHVDDDPTLNPWTFRMFVLGIGLSAFGATLATIFLFKPQAVGVSVIFLTVISYVLGNGMAMILPRKGFIGRWFNPHPFNSKEHLAIIIMSHAASGAAHATEVLATQKLYYNIIPNPVVAILLLFSSQLLGYGMAGVLRKSLVYPTRMLWPNILPLMSLVETLHRDKKEMKKKFNLFWIIFVAVAVWELFPQYIMPALTGISIFCLANRRSLVFTNVFGGTNGNEGMGLFSISFDWQYIGTGAFFLPLITLVNSFLGFLIGMFLFAGLYYGNVWSSLKFPFLSQQLFSPNSSSTHYVIYNQSAILDSENQLNITALETEGIPFYTATNAVDLLTNNLGVTSTIVHMLIWNFDILSAAFVGFSLANIKSTVMFWKKKSSRKDLTDEEKDKLDPHYRMMLAYKEVPSWWYFVTLLLSFVIAIFCIYDLKSTLPWWGFLIACSLSFTTTLFFGAMSGLIGFHVPVGPVIQLIGGYLHAGKPLANMYFVLFGSSSQAQALGLVHSLKLGQYGKLSPRCTFAVQTLGTMFGAIINYILMSSITTNQRAILLSIEGTNIWSGQAIQSFNSNAIAFGALPKYMFSMGRTYQWVVLALPIGLIFPIPFYLLHRYSTPKSLLSSSAAYIITPVIFSYLGYLSVGINSSVLAHFALGFFIQLYMRKYHPAWFLKYNYILAAAISGGTEFLVFVTTFAVQGASGKEVVFPAYWGNNYHKGNFDFCARNPALGG